MSYTLYVISGPSGSGKSTFANHLIDSIREFCYHLETDNYFYVDGVYKFDPTKLGVNHQKCFDDFVSAVKANNGNILISNTGIKKWEYQKYVDYAEKNGFRVFVLAMRQSFQNTHGVPEEKVKQMRQNFEW